MWPKKADLPLFPLQQCFLASWPGRFSVLRRYIYVLFDHFNVFVPHFEFLSLYAAVMREELLPSPRVW